MEVSAPLREDVLGAALTDRGKMVPTPTPYGDRSRDRKPIRIELAQDVFRSEGTELPSSLSGEIDGTRCTFAANT